MKKVFSTVLLLALTLIFMFCMTGCNVSTLFEEDDFDINTVECINLDLSTISNEYSENQYRAEETYLQKYIVTTGQIVEILSDTIKISTTSYSTLSITVYCDIKSTELNEILLSLNKGDKILIKGKMTLMYKSFGMVIHVDTYHIQLVTPTNN